jgi:hypothetical protein
MKRTLIVYGNCQAGVIYYALKAISDVSDRWDLISMRSFVHPVDGHDKLPPEDVDRCGVLLEQGSTGVDELFPYKAQLPADCRTVRFPPLDTNLLWPFKWTDPRNRPEPPDFPFGRYPYGDRIVVELLKHGLAGEELWAAYQQRSVEKLPNLERLQTLEEARLVERDSSCDVAITPVIQQEFNRQRLFWTPNHPTGFLLGKLFGLLLNVLLGEDVARQEEAQKYFLGWQPWSDEVLPIHPEVARRLNLAWGGAQERVAYNGKKMSFEEYMKSYIDWI